MASVAQRIEAAVRQARAIGPVRLIVGLAGLAMSYAVVCLFLIDGRPADIAVLGDLSLALPLIGWFVTLSTAGGNAITAAHRGIAATHFTIVVIVLFLLWGADFLPVHRPETAKDFTLLFPALAGLVFSTMILVAPGRAAIRGDAIEPLPET